MKIFENVQENFKPTHVEAAESENSFKSNDEINLLPQRSTVCIGIFSSMSYSDFTRNISMISKIR